MVMNAIKSRTVEATTVESILAVVSIANSAVAFGGTNAALEELASRGYSPGAAKRVLEMAPVIANFFADEE
jgi:hypothetical protein